MVRAVLSGGRQEALPASAMAPLLREPPANQPDPLDGLLPRTRQAPGQPAAAPHDAIVPGRAFADDLKRKTDLRQVMGHHPDELREAPTEPTCEKAEVNYRYAPDQAQSCGECVHFRPEGACELVAGLIRSVDTCDEWAGQPQEQQQSPGVFDGGTRGADDDTLPPLGPVRARLVNPPAPATEQAMGFDALTRSLAQKPGISDPAALAATIGRAKFGKAGMARKAAAGRRAEGEEGWDDDPFDTLGSDCAPDEQDSHGRCPDDLGYDGPDDWGEGEAAPKGGTVRARFVAREASDARAAASLAKTHGWKGGRFAGGKHFVLFHPAARKHMLLVKPDGSWAHYNGTSALDPHRFAAKGQGAEALDTHLRAASPRHQEAQRIGGAMVRARLIARESGLLSEIEAVVDSAIREAFDNAKHPRAASGNPAGGQFTSGGNNAMGGRGGIHGRDATYIRTLAKHIVDSANSGKSLDDFALPSGAKFGDRHLRLARQHLASQAVPAA